MFNLELPQTRCGTQVLHRSASEVGTIIGAAASSLGSEGPGTMESIPGGTLTEAGLPGGGGGGTLLRLIAGLPDCCSICFWLLSLWNLHMWHPREFLLRKDLPQNLQSTSWGLAWVSC